MAWSGISAPWLTATKGRRPTSSKLRYCVPATAPLFVGAANAITPELAEFAILLFGERMPWTIKEMRVNFLDHGGRQAMHNHANSFISGVVYLTPTDPESQTVFIKSPGGHDFAFKNDRAGSKLNQYSADT